MSGATSRPARRDDNQAKHPPAQVDRDCGMPRACAGRRAGNSRGGVYGDRVGLSHAAWGRQAAAPRRFGHSGPLPPRLPSRARCSAHKKANGVDAGVKHTVLLVGPGARRRALTSNLEFLGMEILFANNWLQARRTLEARTDIAVAVTALTLGDGNWCDVVQHVAQNDFQTAVVVVSRTGSARLWAELLWRGVHDLLVEPLNDCEVRQTIEGAVRAAEAARHRLRLPPAIPVRIVDPQPAQAVP